MRVIGCANSMSLNAFVPLDGRVMIAGISKGVQPYEFEPPQQQGAKNQQYKKGRHQRCDGPRPVNKWSRPFDAKRLKKGIERASQSGLNKVAAAGRVDPAAAQSKLRYAPLFVEDQ
jgi:hypothetical protein